MLTLLWLLFTSQHLRLINLNSKAPIFHLIWLLTKWQTEQYLGGNIPFMKMLNVILKYTPRNYSSVHILNCSALILLEVIFRLVSQWYLGVIDWHKFAACRMLSTMMEAGQVLRLDQSWKNRVTLVTQSGSLQRIICKWVTQCDPESHQTRANLKTWMYQKEQLWV